MAREQMNSNDYAARAHSQGGDDDIEKERLLSSPGGHIWQDTSMEVPRRRALPSHEWIGVAAIALLLINAGCLLITTYQLRLGSQVLSQYLNYADNRDLPRPDPYDGL